MKNIRLQDLLKMKQVVVSTENDNLVWTDEKIFKDFAIKCQCKGLKGEEWKNCYDYYKEYSVEDLVKTRDTMGVYKIINPSEIWKITNKEGYAFRVSRDEIEFLDSDISDVEDLFYDYEILDGIALDFDERNDNVIVTFSEWNEPIFDISYDELYI